MRRIWPKVVKIYWDPDNDIPIVKPIPGTEDLLYVVRLTEPGDARPAFRRDLEKLLNAIVYEYDSKKLFDEFYNGKVLLFNKVPHWDQMWEIVASGNVLGQLYYDPFRDKWRHRLSYAGAYLADEKGIVDFIRVDERIYPKKIVKSNLSTNARQVIVKSSKGIVGLAERISDDEFIIVKFYKFRRSPVETSNRSTDLWTVIRHNDYGLNFYEDKAIKFLRKVYSHHPMRPVVSYSGGKDSLTALHLTLKALGDTDILFNDTGIELPETINNVEYVAQRYGLKLVKASAGDIFWKAVWIFGPPGKDYRWCCKVTKLVPIARTTKRVWPNGALNIVGQRAYESLDRARSPSIWRNRWVPHLLSVSPIQEWNQLLEWLYILRERLPYNRLYDLGFERLGCYVCPSSTLAEFKEVERNYPEHWRRWIEVLEWWRTRLGQPPEWVRYGLWRWLTPAVAKQRLAHHIPGYTIDWRREYVSRLLNSTVNLAPLTIKTENNKVRAVFNRTIIIREAQLEFYNNIRMLGKNIYRENDNIIIETEDTVIAIKENILEATTGRPENLEDLADVLKIIYRIYGCAKCGSCVLWCPYKLVKLTRYGPLPNVPCPGCRICLEVCPISEVLVEKIVLPLFTGDPAIWKRPSRRHGVEVIESFRMAGVIPEED